MTVQSQTDNTNSVMFKLPRQFIYSQKILKPLYTQWIFYFRTRAHKYIPLKYVVAEVLIYKPINQTAY